MESDYKAIWEKEIRALEQQVLSGNEAHRKAAEECLAASQIIRAPKSFPSILDAFFDISRAATYKSNNLREMQGEPVLANILVFRAAMVLPTLIANAETALAQFYEQVTVQDEAAVNRHINELGTKIHFLSGVEVHRSPLDLLVHKRVKIEGDPFEDAIALLKKMETDLKRYRKEGSFGSATMPDANAVVEQAFQRILRMVTATTNTQSRKRQLAEKCQQLKLLFPDAAAQIDRLFRKEAELLDEL